MTAVASHLDVPSVEECAPPPLPLHQQVSSDATVPRFASIKATLEEDVVSVEQLASNGTGFNSRPESDMQEQSGLLFLGTGVSCALPQLAHVLPIADPSHPFHRFIHVPLEQLPSVATLHELAAAHHQCQKQQHQQHQHHQPQQQGKKEEVECVISPVGTAESSHYRGGVSSEARPQGGAGRERENAHDNVAASNCLHNCVSNRCSEDNQRDHAGDGASPGAAGTMNQSSSSSSHHHHHSTSGREQKGGGGDGVVCPEEGGKTFAACQLGCDDDDHQAGEILQETRLRPRAAHPACVSCFMSWKSPSDPNNRGNVSAVLKLGKDKHILIDCGKTFRQAALSFCPRYGIRSLNGVLLTHDHQDAVGGLDDLRDMQPFCRPPYAKAAAVAAAAAEGDSGDIRRSDGIAEKGRSREKEEKKKGEPHLRDMLGYRPCYMLDCFLGVHTYKTICIRYGYIVDASLRMMEWMSEDRQRQLQQQKTLLSDAHRKTEEAAAIGNNQKLQSEEEEEQQQQRRVSVVHGFKDTGTTTTITTTATTTMRGACMRSSCGQREATVHASSKEESISIPARIPSCSADPDWEKAPVFERKVACLAFHLLDDEVPCDDGSVSTQSAVCSSTITTSSKKGEESSAVAAALTTTTSNAAEGNTQRKNDAFSSSSCEQAMTSSLLPQRHTETLIGGTTSQRTAKKDDISHRDAEESNSTNSQGRTRSGEKEAEETSNDNTCIMKSSTSITATRADAAGFCEVPIPGTKTKLLSFPVFHGGSYVCLGYVVGNEQKLVYMSDVTGIPPAVLQRLKSIGDVHTLVIDALSEKLHGSHFSVQEALTVAVELHAREVYFVGMTCTLEHNQTNRRLRSWLKRHQEMYRSVNGGRESRLSHVALAYDGLFLPINF